jgi:hypothetical protein
MNEKHRRIRVRHYARRALVILYPCHDCGAPAGSECRPEYGCANRERRP